jgi:hypothetical protein
MMKLVEIILSREEGMRVRDEGNEPNQGTL